MKYTDKNLKLNKRITTGPNKRLVFWFVAITIVIVLPGFLFEKTANASLFSFFASFWDQPVSASVGVSTSTANSQTIALPQYATNINPINNSGEVAPIGSGDTLVADIALANDTSADAPVNTQISVYTVQSGDNISSVAKMFGVSVNTVLWSNNLNSRSSLHVGDTLVILPISGITYTVKRGDSVQSIVSKYKADLGDVLAYNDISASSTLNIGDTIIIPNVEVKVSIPTRIVFKNNPAHDTDGPYYPGYYIRPIDGGRKTQGLHGYNAVDLADRVGTPIHASAAGTVIVARTGGWNGGYGNFVIISHDNGTQTLYAHASKVLVKPGQYVDQGQTIALLGSTGESTGPHVHFEIRGAKNPF